MFLTSVFNKNTESPAKIIDLEEISDKENVIKNEELYKVIKVVDGDTIVVLYQNNEEKIRLIGVNTPESVDHRRKVECFGKEASSYTKELLENRSVKLEFDNSQGKRDKYGRLLAYIFRDDGLFVNLELIKNGYGHEYTYNIPYKYINDFKAAQKFAKENKLGLWEPGVCENFNNK